MNRKTLAAVALLLVAAHAGYSRELAGVRIPNDACLSSELDHSPKRKLRVPPVWPAGQPPAGTKILVVAVIEPDGTISSAVPVRRWGPDVHKAVCDAVLQWKFVPGTRSGHPVKYALIIGMTR